MDLLLSLLLDEHLVTFFDPNAFTVLYDYPSSQAALSQVEVLNDTEAVAKRFEIYHQSFELANGYQELRDFKTHEERFQRAKQKRDEQDKSLVQTDTFFMRDLQRNELPACCGVAVGFDRLMMLRHQVSNIKDILPFSWSEA